MNRFHHARFLMRGCMAAVATVIMVLSAAAPTVAQNAVERVQFAGPSGQMVGAVVWSPTSSSPAPRPLVVISHGSVGSDTGHRDTAEALADAGFVVAALTHPGDNYRDGSQSLELTNRPLQVSALISFMTEQWGGARGVDATRIGAFGFSAGGFTVLTLAGAESDANSILDHCAAHPAFFLCSLVTPQALDVAGWRPRGADSRVKAIVAAAPGFGFSFSEASLRNVRIPIQLWQAGEDQILIAPYHVEPVRDRLLVEVDYHVVPAALHHDFLTSCGPELTATLPELCRSNPGFDRTAFKQAFNQNVVRFFSRELLAP